MSDSKRITHQFLDAVSLADSRFDRLLIPVLLFFGVAYAALQALEQDWVELFVIAAEVVLLLALAAHRPLRQRLVGQRLNRRHATYVALLWAYSAAWLNVVRPLLAVPSTGKESATFYVLALLAVALTLMIFRATLMLSPWGYRFFATRIPIWEQLLIAGNEAIAAGLIATFIGGKMLPLLLQPGVFTVRMDALYGFSLSAVLLLYYLGMQLMWVQRANDHLSQTHVWVRLSRIFAPLALAVATLVLAQRFIARAEPRTADLLGNTQADLAVLSIGAVIWLVLLTISVLVYTSRRGLRQRFLPDALLALLPGPLARFLSSISDTDLLLILALLSTIIPVDYLLLGDPGGVIHALRDGLLGRGAVLIETPDQALALLFAAPFYALAVALLGLYAYVFGRAAVSARERDTLVSSLPVGFLIVVIITLFLVAVPVGQALTTGRLPRLSQDLGRILAFNVLIPLALLYAHYFALVRWPYNRGQMRWRERENTRLISEQVETDSRIERLNSEIAQLDNTWHAHASPAADAARFDTLFRYMQLNSLRDDLNMQRLQIVAQRQQLADISDAPLSIAVARLPLRIVSLGIPLLIAIQLYQWAVVNNGLREIVNTPNLTVDEFFRIILQQANF
jgi:hypothetical protein